MVRIKIHGGPGMPKTDNWSRADGGGEQQSLGGPGEPGGSAAPGLLSTTMFDFQAVRERSNDDPPTHCHPASPKSHLQPRAQPGSSRWSTRGSSTAYNLWDVHARVGHTECAGASGTAHRPSGTSGTNLTPDVVDFTHFVYLTCDRRCRRSVNNAN